MKKCTQKIIAFILTLTIVTTLSFVPTFADSASVVNWDSVVGGEPGSDLFDMVVDELQFYYADKDYVLVDMSAPDRITYYISDPWNLQVSAELWNALKDMNKSRIIFRAAYYRYDSSYLDIDFDYDGNVELKNGGRLIYEWEIKKEDYSTLDLEEGQFFKIGFDSLYPTDRKTLNKKDTENAVKEALGDGYSPYNFGVYGKNTPYVKATVRVEIPEYWCYVYGWQDCTVYKIYPLDEGGVSIEQFETDVELKSSYTATDVPFKYDKSEPVSRYFEFEVDNSDFYRQFVIVSEEGIVCDHRYDDDYDAECDICKQVRECDHSFLGNVCEKCGATLTFSQNGKFESIDTTVTGNITVPLASNGVLVSVIGAGAFKDCASLLSVMLYDNVTEIADDAFEGVSNNFVIKCYEDSPASKWAEEHGVKYEIVPIPYGNVNADEATDLFDLIDLAKYTVGAQSVIDIRAANTDAPDKSDRTVDLFDLIALAKYVVDDSAPLGPTA